MLGRNIIDYFKSKDIDVTPTDLTGWELSGDLLDKEFVFSRLASVDFDSIIHLAAITDIRKTVENPKLCFEVNCLGTLNVLELAARKNVSRFVLASSANVYGAPEKNPVTEESPAKPRVPYDYSKVISENLAFSYHKTKGLPITVTRSWLLLENTTNPREQ